MYILCVCVSRSGDPGLSPFDLETGMPVASKVENLPSQIGHDRPLGSRIIRRVRDGRRTDRQTDGRTDGQKQRLLPPSLPYGGGGIIIFEDVWRLRFNKFSHHKGAQCCD